MAGVDDAIVEMKFDNALFERKLQETIQSLDKLRASLDFSNAKKGLSDLSTAGKNFNMNGMGQSIEDVSRKFLAMSTIAITALSQITSKALDAGLQVAKAFTIGPIIDGFREMETNMNSIQTILANTESKGTTLEDVNAALQQLNEYSDKTIYNFAQMAKNIGTFTAAGVDLDTSVNSIKGIANLAAVSGSSAEQASGAMYQLSQAIAAGSLKLIDWNSVVNAGMGGEVFKTALFETAKAAGTLTDVPVGQTFKEWEAANGSFRESLQDGWVTSDVLTTTLSTFTGDLSDAQLKAKGFTDAQIANIHKLAATATAAATEVKTFTQLVGTVKESIATGFADSFKLIIGNFAEAKELFTGINNAIGGFVGRTADARNNLILGWRFLGGRERLIQAFKDGFAAVGNVLGAVSKAFRSIFPKKTAEDLVGMTVGFADFTERLKELTTRWMPTIQHLFRGLFAGIEIGFTIFKEFGKLVLDIFGGIGGAAGGPAIDFLSLLSSKLSKLNAMLVQGGGIAAFFDKIREAIKNPAEALQNFSDAITDFFDALRGGKGAADALEGVGGRFEHLQSAFTKVGEIFDWLAEKTEGIRKVLGELWDYIMNFFSNLGDSMKSEMEKGDFEGALDIFNVALLGGIAVMLRNFFKNGFPNIGGGVVEKINEMLSGVTGTLKAMQTELKSRALMQIAIAMGVLTLSLIALSLIDSADLTKALTAMAVGFGELVAAMVAIDTLMSTFSGVKFAIVAAGMVLLAGAMILLAAAMKIMATMSWEEMAKGLVGVAGGLTALVLAMNSITANVAGLIRAGAAMIVMSAGLLVLSLAMKSFATMNWTEMAKGMVAVAGGLTILVTAMNNVDAKDMISAGLGIIAISVGMRIMANAMQAFATMSWEDIAKGLIAVGAALGIIVLLTNTMPIGGMVAIGAGLILVSIAMRIMANAVEAMGGMNIETLAKGLGALAIALTLMVVATNLMTGALPGAAAMLVVAGALVVITEVIQTLGQMKISELIAGMVALAGIFVVLGVAAYFLGGVLPAMIGLGVALALIGVGMAAFGAGAYLAIKAFELLGKVGKKSMLALIDMIAIFAARAPLIGIAIASVIVSAVTDLAEAAPALIKAFKVVILELLDAIIELAPKIGEAVKALFDVIVDVVVDQTPKFIEAGAYMLLSFLSSIRSNIGTFVELGADIITNFLNGLAEEDDKVIDAAVNLILSFLDAISERMPDIVTAGLQFLVNLIQGISENVSLLIDQAVGLVLAFVQGIVDNIGLIIAAGVNMVTQLLLGIAEGALQIAQTVTNIITTFITELGAHATEIVAAGVAALTSFLGGLTDGVTDIAEAVGTLITTVITELGNLGEDIVRAGVTALWSFLDGLQDASVATVRKIAATGLAIVNAIADAVVLTTAKAADIIVDFCHSMSKVIDEDSPRVRAAIGRLGRSIGNAIIDGIVAAIKGAKDILWDAIKELASGSITIFGKTIEVGSPSRVFMRFGQYMVQGLVIGVEQNARFAERASAGVADGMVTNLRTAFDKVAAMVPVFEDINPVITPVLDLTEIRLGAKNIDSMMASASIGAQVSIDRARVLADVANSQNGSEDSPIVPVEQHVTFEQNNYSPKALSANDIYRNTKSQIELAKEELKV